MVLLGDTIGSVESLVSVLTSLDQSKASLNVVLTGVGDVTEGDLKIAQSINGSIYVLPFNCYDRFVIRRNCVRVWYSQYQNH